jgi:hypothetical protein
MAARSAARRMEGASGAKRRAAPKSARGDTQYCQALGGGRRCQHEGCTKAVAKAAGSVYCTLCLQREQPGNAQDDAPQQRGEAQAPQATGGLEAAAAAAELVRKAAARWSNSYALSSRRWRRRRWLRWQSGGGWRRRLRTTHSGPRRRELGSTPAVWRRPHLQLQKQQLRRPLRTRRGAVRGVRRAPWCPRGHVCSCEPCAPNGSHTVSRRLEPLLMRVTPARAAPCAARSYACTCRAAARHSPCFQP